ncbi:MAG: SIMPL domain-containing protein [Acidobacteria bacterium]|nr:SIMPL domain-containing protein [Acidobacteriota bacterium]
MKNFLRLATPLVTLIMALSVASCAKKETRVSRVLVTGESDLKAPPDTALIVLSVVTQNQKALPAQQENARKTEAVIKAIKEAAGENAEIKTSDYSLQPQRNWNGSMPKIVGYEAQNSVTLKTGALDNVGAVIDAATQAGANSVESVSFVLRESNPARGQTLAEASKQAMDKARAMAQALGGRIVRVVEEQEGGFTNRPLTVDERRAEYSADTQANMNLGTYSAQKMSARTPVEAGSLNVRSQVQLIVEIEVPPDQK